MIRTLHAALFVLIMLALITPSAFAAGALVPDFPPGLVVPPGAAMSADFNVERATQAYMSLLTPAQRARSDAYFEGGYWLQLWGFLYSLGVAWLLLSGRRSARVRDWSERLTRLSWLRTMIYSSVYVLAAYLLALPLTIYAGFYRERVYGLVNQSFGPWFGEQLIDLGVNVVISAVFLAVAYAFVRKFAVSWWIWLTAFMAGFLLMVMLIAPVWIMPLFNDYKVLADGAVKSAVLSMARANGVSAENVYWFDASKQTNRVSANVSGFLGTTRVSLNDNLLNKTSLPEIKAVMGHELGHDVLHHALRSAIYYSLVFGLGFAFLNVGARALIRRWQGRFALRDIGDVAALPLVFALFSVFLFVATPVLNSISRQQEQEADLFGLNAAREPYGFAMAAMRLSTYRKMEPGALEERLFFDHPSGHTRIYDSMRWLKENPSAVEGSLKGAHQPP